MKLYIKEDIIDLYNWTKNIQKKFDNKKILIVGHNGFLGKYFCYYFDYLTKKNINLKVTCVDNFASSKQNLLKNRLKNKNFKFINCDASQNTPKGKYDIIIYLAGIASPQIYANMPMEALDVSYNGTKNYLEKSKKDKSKFIFFSSSEIYGNPDKKNIPTKEKFYGYVNSYGPRSCYDEGKRVGETLCYIYKNYFNTRVKIIRPFNVYGPGMEKLDYRVIPNIVKNLKEKKIMNIYGTGNQTRTFCYITDAINGFLQVIAKDNQNVIFNVGNDKNEISIIKLVKVVNKISKNGLKYRYMNNKDYPGDEPQRRCPDLDQMRKLSNYKNKISLEEGIKRTIYFNNDVN